MRMSENIKKIMADKGLSIYKVSKDSKVSVSYVWDIANGKSKNPSIEVLKKLSKGLGVRLEDLIKEE